MKTKQKKPSQTGVTATGSEGWGGASVVHKRVPSGVKLILEPDSDCLLKFIGKRDITELVTAKKNADPIVYLIFHDGLRLVSLPTSYAFTQAELTEGHWYYIHHQGEIERPGLNAMKDLLILQLGVDGEMIVCPERVADSKELTLNSRDISEINYKRLNYPLRKV